MEEQIRLNPSWGMSRVYTQILVYFLCFIMLSLVLAKDVKYLVNTLKSTYSSRAEQTQEEEFTITAQVLVLPTNADRQELKETYQQISVYFADIEALEQEMIRLHDEVKNALVCSDANGYFNSLTEYYATYQQKIDEVQVLISSFTKKYDTYLESILKIPQFSSEHDKQYEEFTSEFEAGYETVQTYSKEVENVESLYLETKQIADDWFEKDFDLMSRIVTQEAGNCDTLERCYVAKVLENRIKSSLYPNNLHDVVYDPGQYEPVMKGTIDQPASESVKKDMEEYLRGRIETGMPDYVLYQARFQQGKIWQHMPSGHYFCYK